MKPADKLSTQLLELAREKLENAEYVLLIGAGLKGEGEEQTGRVFASGMGRIGRGDLETAATLAIAEVLTSMDRNLAHMGIPQAKREQRQARVMTTAMKVVDRGIIGPQAESQVFTQDL